MRTRSDILELTHKLHGESSEDMNKDDINNLLKSNQEELTSEELIYLSQDSGPDPEEEG